MKDLCALDDIPANGCKGFSRGESNFFVVRRGSQIYAYHNRCPHLGIPLEWLPDHFLDESGELIQCSTHGALFVVETGACVAGPCVGDHLDAMPCQIIDGRILVNHAGQ